MVNMTRVWLNLMKSVLLMRHNQGSIMERRERPHQTSSFSWWQSRPHEGLIPVTSLCLDTGVLLAQVGHVAEAEDQLLLGGRHLVNVGTLLRRDLATISLKQSQERLIMIS